MKSKLRLMTAMALLLSPTLVAPVEPVGDFEKEKDEPESKFIPSKSSKNKNRSIKKRNKKGW